MLWEVNLAEGLDLHHVHINLTMGQECRFSPIKTENDHDFILFSPMLVRIV